jgi:hypothetical protein
MRDAIHAADGLEHGGLPVDLLLVEFPFGEVSGEELGEFERLVQDGFSRAGGGRCDEASAGRAEILAVAIEIAETMQEVEKTAGVLCGEFVVECVSVDGLREKLGEVASRIVDDLALFDRFAEIENVGLHSSGARGVDLDFEGNAQLLTVSKQMGVDGGNAGGARVEVGVALPFAGLR